jgi:hypothetical protein
MNKSLHQILHHLRVRKQVLVAGVVLVVDGAHDGIVAKLLRTYFATSIQNIVKPTDKPTDVAVAYLFVVKLGSTLRALVVGGVLHPDGGLVVCIRLLQA